MRLSWKAFEDTGMLHKKRSYYNMKKRGKREIHKCVNQIVIIMINFYHAKLFLFLFGMTLHHY